MAKNAAMVVSGEDDVAAQSQLGDSMLGVQYDVSKDVFMFKPEVQIYSKRRGVRLGPPVNIENITLLDDVKLTPRIVLGLVNSLFDPLGLMSPWYLKFKFLLKKVC